MALLLMVAGVCACSRQEMPKTLARSLSEADHGIITNWMSGSMLLSAEETKRLVQGISTAKRLKGDAAATPEWWIGFFKGTNLLNGFNASGSLFWIDQGSHPGGWRRVTAYLDNSGTLESLMTKLREQAPPRMLGAPLP